MDPNNPRLHLNPSIYSIGLSDYSNHMKYKLIACEVLKKEVDYCLGQIHRQMDTLWVEQGLHTQPDKLCGHLREILTEDHSDCDIILLGYGLCGNGTLGLSCKKKIVIPRAHDCITLLLGSKAIHEEYFRKYPNTYFFNPGWIDAGAVPGKEYDEKLRTEYTHKFGTDNAEYLMEVELSWREKYNRLVFIDWNFPDKEKYIQYTKECAEYLKWEFKIIEGNAKLMIDLLSGNWNPEDFLILEPGQTITEELTGPATGDKPTCQK